MKTCKRCGADWQERVNDPRYCPLCKSPYWNKEKVRDAGIRDGVGRVDRIGGPDNRAVGEGLRGRRGAGPGVGAECDGANGKRLQADVREREANVAGSGTRPSHAAGCKCLMCKGRV